MTPTYRVGIVLERRPSKSPWIDHSWRVAAVVPEAAVTPDGAVLGGSGEVAMIYAGSREVEFHRVETGNYRDNLTSGRPSLWVTLQRLDGGARMRLVSVTADPAEGESRTEAGDLVVETAPMPAEMAEDLAAFVAEHHVERVFKKRKRI